jgi:hypothetical protein
VETGTPEEAEAMVRAIVGKRAVLRHFTNEEWSTVMHEEEVAEREREDAERGKR